MRLAGSELQSVGLAWRWLSLRMKTMFRRNIAIEKVFGGCFLHADRASRHPRTVRRAPCMEEATQCLSHYMNFVRNSHPW